MKGGKWSIPEKKMKKFYKLCIEQVINGDKNYLLVEKMRDYFPFVIDIDLKYKSHVDRQYNNKTIEKLNEYLWKKITECIHITETSGKNILFLMEKEKTYPCDKQDYKSKDGIHLAFPELIIDKSSFKQIISKIQSDNKIKEIFTEYCIEDGIGPDNNDKEIFDSSFSSWQLYGCHKENESPYLVTKIYKFNDMIPSEIDQDEFQEFYSDPLDIMNQISMCYRKQSNISYTEEFSKTFKQKQPNTISSSNMVQNDDIYGNGYYVDNNNVINPFKIVEEEELKLVKGLVRHRCQT